MSLSRALALKLVANTRDFERDLKGSTKSVDRLESKIKAFGKAATGALAGVAVAAAYMGAKLAFDAVQAASDLEEALSKNNVIFGKSAKTIEAFTKTTAKTMGLSQKSALDATSTFAVFGKSAGLTGDKLVEFSKQFTTLAADLASFNNTTPEEAITALGAAFRGENEPIRRYNVLLNDAALKQEALNMGIYNGKGALTAQQKTMAAASQIMKQTKDAQGDYAKTSDGLANSQKTLTAIWADMEAQLGLALAPTFKGFVDWLKTDGVEGVTTFIDVLQGKSGKTLQQAMLSGKTDMDGLTYGAMSENQAAWADLATSVKNLGTEIGNFYTKLDIDNPASGFNKMLAGFSTLADLLTTMMNAVEFMSNHKFTIPVVGVGWNLFEGVKNKLFGGERAMGGPVNTGSTYLVGENGPELFTPGTSGNITPNHKLGGSINITVNALDPAAAARAVQSALNKAQRMGVSRYAGAAS